MTKDQLTQELQLREFQAGQLALKIMEGQREVDRAKAELERVTGIVIFIRNELSKKDESEKDNKVN